MAINLTRDDNATSIGSESLVYLAPCVIESSDDSKTILASEWYSFPCVIKENLSLEPKTGEIMDDRGRVVYSYSQPSKAKYSGSIFQRDADTFDWLRDAAGKTYVMWVVVGQVGNKNQEILMYGKLGGNYTEDMSAEPNIPIEFNCEVNPVDITANCPDDEVCFANTIQLKARAMVKKVDTVVPPPVA